MVDREERKRKTKTGNNHQSNMLLDSERWLKRAPHARTKEPEEILSNPARGLMGRQGETGNRRERAYPSPFHSGKRVKQGASPYLYQLTGTAVMWKEGGRGPVPAAVALRLLLVQQVVA